MSVANFGSSFEMWLFRYSHHQSSINYRLNFANFAFYTWSRSAMSSLLCDSQEDEAVLKRV